MGSSPQVRGRFDSHRDGVVRKRLIPAGAGQICFTRVYAIHSGAHPRRCGADIFIRNLQKMDKGSSPQVRGRLAGTLAYLQEARLIPAGAGQMQPACWRSPGHRAHPRRCGADNSPAILSHTWPGSSPQVRGRSHRGAVSWGLGGLIPAGAGQIPRRGPNQFAVPAHPRRCGADLMTYRKTGVRMGSSPQVRGRWRSKDRAHTSCGLIPAGAGQIY